MFQKLKKLKIKWKWFWSKLTNYIKKRRNFVYEGMYLWSYILIRMTAFIIFFILKLIILFILYFLPQLIGMSLTLVLCKYCGHSSPQFIGKLTWKKNDVLESQLDICIFNFYNNFKEEMLPFGCHFPYVNYCIIIIQKYHISPPIY